MIFAFKHFRMKNSLCSWVRHRPRHKAYCLSGHGGRSVPWKWIQEVTSVSASYALTAHWINGIPLIYVKGETKPKEKCFQECLKEFDIWQQIDQLLISLFLCVLKQYAYLLYVFIFTFKISMFIEQFVSITHKTRLIGRLQKQEVEVSVGFGFILLLKENVAIMLSLKVCGRQVEHSRCWKG